MTQPWVEIGCHELPREAVRGGGGQSFAVGPNWIFPSHKLLIHFLHEAKMHVFSLSAQEEKHKCVFQQWFRSLVGLRLLLSPYTPIVHAVSPYNNSHMDHLPGVEELSVLGRWEQSFFQW